MDAVTLTALLPIIIILFLGIVTAIGSRAIGLSPIVGYLILGLILRAGGLGFLFDKSTIALLAQLGVIFLLFDIGLHFSLADVRKQAGDIFAFGPFQVLFATVALGIVGVAFGLKVLPAFLVGGVLSLSSTAVVAGLIGERHQRSCPVGLTATSILIFQDIAAIFLLIIANSLNGGGSVWLVGIEALAKAAAAFLATILIARLVIGPLLRLVARSRNEEVFTASALLIALAAGWATGWIGLSFTLGAFLGGVTLAETPYRAVIESEIKPFRGLLLGFFFISIGLSLDVGALVRSAPVIMALTVLLLGVKILTNIAASRIFKWSIPGSTQLGFLLAQGSEFAFVILSLPAVRTVIGEARASVLIAVVALSLAVTPHLAEAGRSLAGRLRRTMTKSSEAELTPRALAAPVIIVGMGVIGRMVADALIKFDIGYYSVERDEQHLRLAIADGYNATFGDGFDLRMWGPVDLQVRKVSVLTVTDIEALAQTSGLAKTTFPSLKRFAAAKNETDAQKLRNIGLIAIVDRRRPAGLDIAVAVLAELNVDASDIEDWVRDQTNLKFEPSAGLTEAA
jgi:CPA2 family monovalent cation:H+ antiporter-2